VTLIPFPIAADTQDEMSWQSFRRLNGEYAKYLASWVRVMFFAPAREI
jgi:hypothetical protein